MEITIPGLRKSEDGEYWETVGADGRPYIGTRKDCLCIVMAQIGDAQRRLRDERDLVFKAILGEEEA